MMRSIYPLEVLVVESDAEHVCLITQALDEARINLKLHVVRDGADAMAFLHGEGCYARVPRPNLVFLDLNLPGMSGGDVLAQVKSDEELKGIPVIVFSTSDAPDDVARAYELHANCYVTKPEGAALFLDTMRAIQKFWLGTVKFPTSARVFHQG